MQEEYQIRAEKLKQVSKLIGEAIRSKEGVKQEDYQKLFANEHGLGKYLLAFCGEDILLKEYTLNNYQMIEYYITRPGNSSPSPSLYQLFCNNINLSIPDVIVVFGISQSS